MRIQISEQAAEDLLAGFQFYERQEEGVGRYFLDSLFADIDSLVLYAGVHVTMHGYHRMIAKRFPFAITRSSVESSAFGEFSTADAIRAGRASN